MIPVIRDAALRVLVPDASVLPVHGGVLRIAIHKTLVVSDVQLVVGLLSVLCVPRGGTEG
jgi:hypothetical protein